MLGRVEDVVDTMTLAEALFPVVNGGEAMSHPANAAEVRRIIGLMEEVRDPTSLGRYLQALQALQVTLTL